MTRAALRLSPESGLGEPFLIALLGVGCIFGALAGIGTLTARETGNVPVCVASAFAQHGRRLAPSKDRIVKTRVDAYCRCLDDAALTTKERRARKSATEQAATFQHCTVVSLSCEPTEDDDGNKLPLLAEAVPYCACLARHQLPPKALAARPAAERRAAELACGKEASIAALTYQIDTSLPVH